TRSPLSARHPDSRRAQTAWISPTLIFGGESTTHTRTSGPPTQFHPATIQWRTASTKPLANSPDTSKAIAQPTSEDTTNETPKSLPKNDRKKLNHNTGEIGWIRLYQSPPIDATATSEGLDITTTGDVTFLIHAPGLNPSQLNEKLTAKTWTLPNLPITLSTDATTFKAEPTTPTQPDTYTLTYTHLTHLHLTIPKL
ncbi:hypothetical protein, partial [Granulicella sp. dw_53]|uniref:hypothetical protein n=1 Tax=Granulicella sp. dw_53 TaxID=2719792 RepID=UPI001BD30663